MVEPSNSLIGRVHFVRQPTPNTCGQTCVAMLTGETVEQVCEGIGNWHGTTLWELLLALRGSLGRKVVSPASGKDYRIEELRVFVPLGLVGIDYPAEPERAGHWVLWVGDAYLDPAVGELDPAEAWGLYARDGARPTTLTPLELP